MQGKTLNSRWEIFCQCGSVCTHHSMCTHQGVGQATKKLSCTAISALGGTTPSQFSKYKCTIATTKATCRSPHTWQLLGSQQMTLVSTTSKFTSHGFVLYRFTGTRQRPEYQDHPSTSRRKQEQLAPVHLHLTRYLVLETSLQHSSRPTWNHHLHPVMLQHISLLQCHWPCVRLSSAPQCAPPPCMTGHRW